MLNELLVKQVMRDRERETRQRVRDNQDASHLPSRSIRRAVGRSIVSIGYRLAAEPQPRLARSR